MILGLIVATKTNLSRVKKTIPQNAEEKHQLCKRFFPKIPVKKRVDQIASTSNTTLN
jgi:hypothetical protein